MSRNLESPYEKGVPKWDALYLARGEEIATNRPTFTGDVYTGILLPGETGAIKARTVLVLQHPCAMRTDGVNLAWQLLVAEVTKRKALSEQEWSDGYFSLMPLPDLRPEATNQARHQAACFDNLYMIKPAELGPRIACLSPFGVNLLLQRWVHYSSRVVVPTSDFQQQTAASYEECDLIEEWCDEAANDFLDAASECMQWLRADRGGSSYQEMLKDSQTRSTVRKAMRVELKCRRTADSVKPIGSEG